MSLIDLRALALLAASAAVLTGCAAPKAADGSALLTPTQQYTPKVAETAETLALSLHPTGLSDNQRQALAVYAAKYREDPTAELTLRVPQGGGDDLIPTRMAAQVVQTLEGAGVARARIRLAAYDGTVEPGSPVVLSYQRHTPEIPDCSSTWSNVVATGGNGPTKNFGCATSSNFAAMVADPRDILRPAAVEPGDNSRRQVVLDKYRQGLVTSSAKDDQAQGVISQQVK